jgi:hypothetical protein
MDERIAAIEAKLPYPAIAGTALNRCQHPKGGLQWCLSLGPLGMPKTFFYGPTIEDVLSQGEYAVANMKGGRLPTESDKLGEVLAFGPQ